MMNNLDAPIFDIDRGHMRFSIYTRQDTDDILFMFQCSEDEAKVGETLTPEARSNEKCENVFGFVIHGKDCAEVIADVISRSYENIEKARKKEERCNRCEFYDGVLNVQGCAPCTKTNPIHMTLWDDCCSYFSWAKMGG